MARRGLKRELQLLKEKVNGMQSNASPWMVGTVTASDQATRTATIQAAGKTYTGIPVQGTFLPKAGSTALVMMNGGAPLITPSQGAVVQQANYTSGVSGYALFDDGSAEFNNVVVRGILDASVVRANTLTNGTVNLLTNPSAETAPAGTELLPNTGFETNTTGWSANTNATIARSTSQARTGTASLLVTANSSANCWFNTTGTGTSAIPVNECSNYVFTWWQKQVGGSVKNVQVWIDTYDSTGTAIASGLFGSVAVGMSTSAFVQGTANFSTQPKVAYVRIYLRVNSAVVTTEQYFFDDMHFAEDIVGAFAYPVGSLGATTGDGYVLRSTAQAHTGSASFSITGATGLSTLDQFAMKPVSVTVGDSYLFSVWTRAAVSQGIRLGCVFLDSTKTQVSTYLGTTYKSVAANTWAQTQTSFLVPTGVSYMIPVIAWTGPTAANPLFVDDCSLVRTISMVSGAAVPDVVISRTEVYDATGVVFPIGGIIPWAGNATTDAYRAGNAGLLPTSIVPPQDSLHFIPPGWLLCDGAAVSRTTYTRLFNIIGTTYGAGDGSTTFAVPDLRGLVPVGKDDMGGTDRGILSSSNTLGTTGGEETHLLLSAESGLRLHTHPVKTAFVASGLGVLVMDGAGGGTLASTNFEGGQDATNRHNNMQPFITLNYLIKC